jgi:hypothetical protein
MAEPTPESIAAKLDVEERLLLFCIGSETDWSKVGIGGAVARKMVIKGVVAHDRKTNRFVLTGQGRAVLAALLAGVGIELAPMN